VGAVLREMIAESVPRSLSEQVKELVDGVTVKLGGRPLAGPLVSASPLLPGRRNEARGGSRADLERMADDGCPHSEREREPKGAGHALPSPVRAAERGERTS